MLEISLMKKISCSEQNFLP